MVATMSNWKSSFEAGSSRSWIAWDIRSGGDISGCIISVRTERRQSERCK
jgi:hypothetical protein